MDLFSELQSAVLNDLTADSTSTLFPTDTVKLAINRAYRRIGGMYRWPETEDAKKTSTVADQEYYDYPDNWKPDSVWKLSVDDVDYGDPLVFKDYLYEKENSFPSGFTKAWANQWRRFFIYPTPSTNGSFNISIWGQKVVDSLSADTDVTIFSYSMPEVNDAIVMEAVSILNNKVAVQPILRSLIGGTQLLNIVAQNIVTIAWNKVRQENTKYEKTQPFFDVPDLFGKGTQKQNTGNFD